MKIAITGACLTVALQGEAQPTQNLVLDKVFVKWLVDGSPELKDPEVFCWNLKDLILEGEDLPSMKMDTRGPRIALDFDIEKTKSNCKLNQTSGPGWKVESDRSDGMELALDVSLPFSRFVMEDSRGRKLEILVEAKFLELQDSDFLSFFKDSLFSIRIGAIRNQVWQLPFLLTKYELPTILGDRLALQIALGQSLFDGSGKGYRQAVYELGLATPVFGEKLPFQGPYNIRLRIAYEGTQINDQKSLGIYPLLAGQMFGFGSEFYGRINEKWGGHILAGYYLSSSEAANLRKFQTEGAARYVLSERWSVEAGLKFFKQNIDNSVTGEKSSFGEYTYFVGINLKPYLDRN